MTFVVPSSAAAAAVAEFVVDAVPPLVAVVIVTVVFCVALTEVWPCEWLLTASDLGITVGPLPDEEAPQQLLPPRSGLAPSRRHSLIF